MWRGCRSRRGAAERLASLAWVVRFSLRLLHLAVVETVPGGASLYGRSIQGHHVAALVKALPTSDQVSIDIKCGDDAIANGLLSELSAHF